MIEAEGGTNMAKMNEDQSREVILRSAALRGRGKFKDALALIESNLPNLAPACLLNAGLEALYAAREGGMREAAVKWARELSKIDPEIPGAKRTLEDWG